MGRRNGGYEGHFETLGQYFQERGGWDESAILEARTQHTIQGKIKNKFQFHIT